MKPRLRSCIGCAGLLAVLLLGLLVLFWPLTGIQVQYGLRCFTASAMQRAAADGDMAAVKRIVGRYPDMANCTTHGIKDRPYTALGTAVQNGHTDVAAYLLGHGANPNAMSHFATPLNAAVRKNNGDIVRRLVTKGAKLAPDRGPSALETAIRCRNWEMCKLLRGLGAKDVPLVCEAVAQGNIPLIEREVRRNGVVPHVGCVETPSLVHLAVAFEQVGSVKALARLGADVSNTDFESGQPPLAVACRSGNMAVVKALVECGARLEWPGLDTEMENGLYYAVLGSHPEVVRYLLDKGVDPNATRGPITSSLASEDPDKLHSNREMASLLVSRGFIPNKSVLRWTTHWDERGDIQSYLWTHAK